jgi:hypothetical protein
MPKNRRRDKREKRPMRSRTAPNHMPAHSVKELLTKRLPALTRFTDEAARQAERQNFWNQWLSVHLPPEIRTRICRLAERDGTLTLFAETAAWSARLRYAVLELEADIRAAAPDVARIEVRVRPR